MPCWEIIASGRVQGVGFRWFVSKVAYRYGIKGYVKNLPDGTVKILAIADSEQLTAFATQVKQGNRYCMVERLQIDELADYQEYEEFFIA